MPRCAQTFLAAFRNALLALGACLIATVAGPGSAAGAEAEAAQPPLKMKLLVSSRADQCYDRGDILAIKTLAGQERDRINAQGGIGGHRLELDFLDDERDDQRAIANVRAAVADPETLALIGLGFSARAKAVFDAAGAEIKGSGIPFLSSISITSIFADHPNVFTTRASQDDERLPVLLEFVKQVGARGRRSSASRTACSAIRWPTGSIAHRAGRLSWPIIGSHSPTTIPIPPRSSPRSQT